MITKKLFDSFCGKDIYIYELSNDKLKVGITNFGGAIQYIIVQTPKGEVDVCLGFDNVKDYWESGIYCGATIGRVANRIAGGKFVLNGNEYELSKNDNGNTLHGGEQGFDKKFYDIETDGDILIMSLKSQDGEMGFPATLNLKVEFELNGDSLEICYTAESDKNTVWNPTCHAYFNLNGEGEIYNNNLYINASRYTPIDANLIPTGEVLTVVNTPFDFTDYKAMGNDINADNEQLKFAGGYDHNFALLGEHAASAFGVLSGIRMDVYTDMPGLQFYSGNFVKGNGKNGKLSPRVGFCLEPQYFPNAVNIPWFESPILKAGNAQTHFISYKFTVQN